MTTDDLKFKDNFPSNEWLRRKYERTRSFMWYDHDALTANTDVKELQKAMFVTLWVDDTRGRRHVSLDVLPFEEVMFFTFVGEVLVSGFSIWLNGREILWQRVCSSNLTIPVGGRLEINMKSLNMELLPFILS